MPQVGTALDLDPGGGEVLGEVPRLPARMVATEGWAPNAHRARERLGPRGVAVVQVAQGEPLPFADATFDLVTARRPVAPDWAQVHRVLRPGGAYLAQHVGPASVFELIEALMGPQPQARRGRHHDCEAQAARAAGLDVVDLRTARLRIEIHDVGAVVWLLRKCVWWVPDFTVERYRDRLLDLDAGMRAGEPFVAHSTRHLVEARRPR